MTRKRGLDESPFTQGKTKRVKGYYVEKIKMQQTRGKKHKPSSNRSKRKANHEEVEKNFKMSNVPDYLKNGQLYLSFEQKDDKEEDSEDNGDNGDTHETLFETNGGH